MDTNTKKNNGCDETKPLTNPMTDPNARCNHCKWFLNRCHPGSGCTPDEYAATDRRMWTI